MPHLHRIRRIYKSKSAKQLKSNFRVWIVLKEQKGFGNLLILQVRFGQFDRVLADSGHRIFQPL